MLNSYEDIFIFRGEQYHNAMIKYPHARDKEFNALLKYVDVLPTDIVADMPSGDCSLGRYINNQNIYFIDPTKAFLDLCECGQQTTQSHLDNTPFKDEYFDKVFSLAGSHHIENKHLFYEEVHRTLKRDGAFVYADVLEGSKEDHFLNGFVTPTTSKIFKETWMNLMKKT